MARPLRIEYPGAFYHVTVRGNARQDIFVDDEDRRRWATYSPPVPVPTARDAMKPFATPT